MIAWLKNVFGTYRESTEERLTSMLYESHYELGLRVAKLEQQLAQCDCRCMAGIIRK